MRKCVKCRRYIRLWQPYYTDKTGNKIHITCPGRKNIGHNKDISIKHNSYDKTGSSSRVFFFNNISARFVGFLIVIVGILLGEFFTYIKQTEMHKLWITITIILITAIIYAIGKMVDDYTSRKINPH